MADTIQRAYSVSDDKMLSTATVFASMYDTDKIAFQNFAPTIFKEDYLPIFRDLISVAYSVYGDEQIRSEQARETKAVADQMAICRQLFGKISFYAETAFEKDTLKLGLFGIGHFTKSSSSADSLMLFMSRFNEMVKESKAALIAVGCTEKLIADSVAQTAKLKTLRDEQLRYKMVRSDLTRKRIEHYNSIWECMAEISRAARGAFIEHPAHAAQYALPYPVKGETVEPVSDEQLPNEEDTTKRSDS